MGTPPRRTASSYRALQGSNPPQLPQEPRPRCYGQPDDHRREGVHVLPHVGRGPNPLFDEWGGRVSAVFVVPANGTRRIPQYSTALKDDLTFSKTDMELLCRPGGAQASGGVYVVGQWSLGLVCVEDGPPPPKKKDFGHSGIFLNNTSPDPDASLPNPALQRLFDLCVFSSRANENAPANMEVLPSGLASSQHAHLVSASASASASASVRRHRPPLPLPPPPPPPPLGPQVPALRLLLGQSPASHVSSRLARLVPSGLFLLDGDAGSPNPTRCSSDDRRNV